MVDGLLDCLSHRTHRDDYVLGLRVSVVVERAVASACKFADFAHISCNNVRNCLVGSVACLACLEIDVTVLCGTTGYRRVRIERTLAEPSECLGADHFSERILIDQLYFLDLVRCAESVEEMDEGNA